MTTILEHAYHEDGGVYAGAFGSDRLDASVLLMPMMGLVAADDERMLATIHAIDRELSVDGLVRRWSGTSDDEGAFVISRDGSLLGNFPQAFSHVGLITAAWAIHEATQREEGDR